MCVNKLVKHIFYQRRKLGLEGKMKCCHQGHGAGLCPLPRGFNSPEREEAQSSFLKKRGIESSGHFCSTEGGIRRNSISLGYFTDVQICGVLLQGS